MRHLFLITVLLLQFEIATAWDIDWKFDKDLSCCLQEVHLQKHFVIKLEAADQLIGNMLLTTPEGIHIGVNTDDTQYFHTPNKRGLYALGPRPNKSITSQDWDFSRYILLFRQNATSRSYIQYEKLGRSEEINPQFIISPGNYELEIIGSHKGNYKIIIFPRGTDELSSAITWPKSKRQHIEPDELHLLSITIANDGTFSIRPTH